MTFWATLTGRLFRLVFGWYLALAIVVTAVQLALEYASTRETVAADLVSLGRSFAPGAADALWLLDQPRLDAVTSGIVQTAVVTGARIVSGTGDIVSSAGAIPALRHAEDEGLLAPFLAKLFPLEFRTPRGTARMLGQLELYSDRQVILSRVQYSFVVILVNSLVKTAGLWVIFYLVTSRSLAKPLSLLTQLVSRMEFAASSAGPLPLDYPHPDELGRLVAAMHTMQDRLATTRAELDEVTHALERKVAERTHTLQEAVEFNQAIILHSPLPMAVYAADGGCVLANAAYAALVETSRGTLLAQNFNTMPSWAESGLRDACLGALRESRTQTCAARLPSSSGRELWVDCSILPIQLNDAPHLLVQFVDLTERNRLEQELREQAFHDSLTGLPNRRLFVDRLRQALLLAKRQNEHLAVLFVDLDRFKELNDSRGHDVGDLLLIETARRLKQVVRASDTVARLGGDEFVVLLEGLGPGHDQAVAYASSVRRKIIVALGTEYQLGGIRHRSTASIGQEVVSGDETDTDLILRRADQAMYEVKKTRQPETLPASGE